MTRALAGGPVRDKPLTIAAYTSAWAANADEIAERDRKGAAGLIKADVIARHAAEHAAFTAALDGLTRDVVVRARRGPIRVSDFLATRVNELVVHSRDLSASVPDVSPVEIDDSALAVSVRMLLDILVTRAPGRSVEVRVPPYAAVQCLEGKAAWQADYLKFCFEEGSKHNAKFIVWMLPRDLDKLYDSLPPLVREILLPIRDTRRLSHYAADRTDAGEAGRHASRRRSISVRTEVGRLPRDRVSRPVRSLHPEP